VRAATPGRSQGPGGLPWTPAQLANLITLLSGKAFAHGMVFLPLTSWISEPSGAGRGTLFLAFLLVSDGLPGLVPSGADPVAGTRHRATHLWVLDLPSMLGELGPGDRDCWRGGNCEWGNFV